MLSFNGQLSFGYQQLKIEVILAATDGGYNKRYNGF
jgi:hypothetical protein